MPDLADVLAHLGQIHRRVEDVAGLTTGAADERRAHPLGLVPGDGGRTFRRLVVGMGMDLRSRRSEDIVDNATGLTAVRCRRSGALGHADRHQSRLGRGVVLVLDEAPSAQLGQAAATLVGTRRR